MSRMHSSMVIHNRQFISGFSWRRGVSWQCLLLTNGLKQAPREWFSHFSEVVIPMKFQPQNSDYTGFFQRNKSGQCVIMLLYVDDIIATGDDTHGIIKVKTDLSQAFDLKISPNSTYEYIPVTPPHICKEDDELMIHTLFLTKQTAIGKARRYEMLHGTWTTSS